MCLPDVTFVVPAYNAEPTMASTLRTLLAQDYASAVRVIVVDDGSTDCTADIVRQFATVELMSVENGGAARATNLGVAQSQTVIVISVDSDVVLSADWLQCVVPWFSDSRVGAVAGYVGTGNTDVVGRVAGFWSEYRHRRQSGCVDNSGSANTAYLKEAFVGAGMFDESLRVGYDVVMSRSLVGSGWKLVRERRAKCLHYWRSSLRGYLRQQSDYAYYRLEIARRFGKIRNDGVGTGLLVGFGLFVTLVGSCLVLAWQYPQALFLGLGLPLLHVPEAVGMARLARDVRLAVLGPPVLVLRDMAWVWGLGRYVVHLLRARRQRYRARPEGDT